MEFEEEKKEMLGDVSDVESEDAEEEDEEMDAVIGDEQVVAKAIKVLETSRKMGVTVSEMYFEKASYGYVHTIKISMICAECKK